MKNVIIYVFYDTTTHFWQNQTLLFYVFPVLCLVLFACLLNATIEYHLERYLND